MKTLTKLVRKSLAILLTVLTGLTFLTLCLTYVLLAGLYGAVTGAGRGGLAETKEALDTVLDALQLGGEWLERLVDEKIRAKLAEQPPQQVP
jgi:hypothetical protein